MNIKTKITVPVLLILVLLIVLPLWGAMKYFHPRQNDSDITFLSEVRAEVDGVMQEVTLPYSFKPLAPRTDVVISTTMTPKPSDMIYIKSVYAPAKIYVDDQLIFEFGQLSQYPSYMIDPPTEVQIIPLGDYTKEVTLRMEFSSLISRDVLTIHPPILGSTMAIIIELSQTLYLPFIFSIIQLIVGVLLIVIAFMITLYDKKGIIFLWLGLFSISTGAWVFGECSLTGLIVKNHLLRYLMVFMGFFSMCVPLLFFAMSIIHFKRKKLIWCLAIAVGICDIVALILQFTGTISLSESMYAFHLIAPMVMCILSCFTIYEAVRYKNLDAKRFVIPIVALSLSSLLEVFNYKITFTYLFTSIFQLGILFFIIFSAFMGGLYIRDMLKMKVAKREVEFELNLMEMQVDEQQKRNLIVLDTAEATRQQQHDLRHQLLVMRELATTDSAGLTQYIDQLISDIPSSQKNYCENMAVNAIVSRYDTICKANNIDFNVSLIVPSNTKLITDSSLCIIFGNLLENAVEACGRMTDGHKFIHLSSSMQFNILTITLDNSFSGIVEQSEEKFYSSKRDHEFGLGLASVTSVAKKAQGNTRFETEGLVFMSSVYVNV